VIGDGKKEKLVPLGTGVLKHAHLDRVFLKGFVKFSFIPCSHEEAKTGVGGICSGGGKKRLRKTWGELKLLNPRRRGRWGERQGRGPYHPPGQREMFRSGNVFMKEK